MSHKPKSWSQPKSPQDPGKFIIRMHWPDAPQGQPRHVDLPWPFDSATDLENAIDQWRVGPLDRTPPTGP